MCLSAAPPHLPREGRGIDLATCAREAPEYSSLLFLAHQQSQPEKDGCKMEIKKGCQEGLWRLLLPPKNEELNLDPQHSHQS